MAGRQAGCLGCNGYFYDCAVIFGLIIPLSIEAKYLAIWPTIFISPQIVPLAPSGPLRGESALSLVFTVVLVTDVLLQLDHVSGTTYLPVRETRKSAVQNSENN